MADVREQFATLGLVERKAFGHRVEGSHQLEELRRATKRFADAHAVVALLDPIGGHGEIVERACETAHRRQQAQHPKQSRDREQRDDPPVRTSLLAAAGQPLKHDRDEGDHPRRGEQREDRDEATQTPHERARPVPPRPGAARSTSRRPWFFRRPPGRTPPSEGHQPSPRSSTNR
jgi:hypothetical protein